MRDSNRAERLHRVRTVFERALELTDEAARARYLDDACGPDQDVRAEIDRLLRNHDQIADRVSFTLPRFGPYQATRQIGRGGMGVVYEAHRADGQYDRRVAIKVLAEATLGIELRQDMLRERQILAGLMHPGIAQLFDGGATESGDPYLVVEYIDGEHFDRYCDRNHLSPAERLKIFGHVLDAIEYAHRNGVAHRDLKPSNILVRADGQPKLVDFGTAQTLQAAPGEANRCYTPEYGSPEMASGDDAGARSDIYSLGVLYAKMLGRHARPEIVTRATQEDPALRYADVASLRRDIFARRWPRWTLAVVAGLALISAGGYWVATRPPAFRPVHPAALSAKDAVVSWNGRTMAFTVDAGTVSSRDIWTSGPNVENAKSLFHDDIPDGDPTLSPDGRFVAFRSASEPAGIHEYDRETRTRRSLVPGGHLPLYSPDGKWLLFADGDDRDDTARASNTRWAVAPARGGQPVLLSGELRSIFSTVWLADGTSVLFEGSPVGWAFTRIWRYRVRDRQLELLTEWKNDSNFTICAVDPDGKAALGVAPGKQAQPPRLMRLPLQKNAQPATVAALPSGSTGCVTDQLGTVYIKSQRLTTRHFKVSVHEPAPQAIEIPRPELTAQDPEEPWSILSASRDGRVVAYISPPLGSSVVTSPAGTRLFQQGQAYVSGDGRIVWLQRSVEPPALTKLALAAPAAPLLELSLFAVPWGVSVDGSKVFALVHPSQRRAISVVESDARVSPIYRHQDWNLYRARPSADERWAAFTGHAPSRGLRVFVAPYRGSHTVPDKEWIEIDEGTTPEFSIAGDRLYFTSERDGHWCIYQRDLDPQTKRPIGATRPLVHLHSDFTAAQLPDSFFTITSSEDALRFSLGRMSHRVFRME